jgi:hypothetical protein
MLDIGQLAVDDERADDQADGDKELEDDQAAAQSCALLTGGERSLSVRDRIKGGDDKGRVEACQQSGHHYDQQQAGTNQGLAPQWRFSCWPESLLKKGSAQ